MSEKKLVEEIREVAINNGYFYDNERFDNTQKFLLKTAIQKTREECEKEIDRICLEHESIAEVLVKDERNVIREELEKIKMNCVVGEDECSKRGVGAYKEADDGKEMDAKADVYSEIIEMLDNVLKILKKEKL